MKNVYDKMKIKPYILLCLLFLISCKKEKEKANTTIVTTKKTPAIITAKHILGNPKYPAISFGGYRTNSRDIQPSVKELKEDMKILHAIGIRLLRTYNVHLPHATNVLKAIRALKKEQPNFEMYVMLGAWIECKNAGEKSGVDHTQESQKNKYEIEIAVKLANDYPDIVKIISVGNEAMVKWATAYYVGPEILLKWVNYLQILKNKDILNKEVWITCSDNFASWGGGGKEYHNETLNKLIAKVDFISMHTYPMHDTHYNPEFWGITLEEKSLYTLEKIEKAMLRAIAYAESQLDSVKNYVKSLGVDKPIHIGETGWASMSSRKYGKKGSKATDEYKQAIFYHYMKEWAREKGISCFYFEAFDEIWKDKQNPKGSENNFGLFTIDGKAKYALWNAVDEGVFKGLTRNGEPITKTYEGSVDSLLQNVHLPPIKKALSQ